MSGDLVVARSLLLLLSVGCFADDAQTIELRAIREQLALIRRDQQQLTVVVDAIRALLSGKGAPPNGAALDNVSAGTRNVPARGKKTASVGVMEFSDYQCSYCREHITNVMPSIEE